MLKDKKRAIVGVIFVLFFAAIIVHFFMAVEVYQDKVFVDVYSGSRKGYREWRCGWITNEWYKKTALESFVELNSKPGNEIDRKWVRSQGDGKSFFGLITSRHGGPGTVLKLSCETINKYMEISSEEEKKIIRDTLISGNEKEIIEMEWMVVSRLSEVGAEYRSGVGSER